MGREAYENLLGPLYGGLYASDPADMVVELSLGHVLREFGIGRSLLLPLLRRGARIDPPPACSFREGLETLPAALFAANRESVRLSSPVERLRREGGAIALDVGGERIAGGAVVLTTPAPAAARLLARRRARGGGAARRPGYNPLAVVHLHAETDLRGLGYQVSLAERLLTRGVTFNDSLFGREGVYTAYLGGAKAPEVVERADEEIGRIAVEEFARATAFDARVLRVERERMPAWDASWRRTRRDGGAARAPDRRQLAVASGDARAARAGEPTGGAARGGGGGSLSGNAIPQPGSCRSSQARRIEARSITQPPSTWIASG